ncbi:hypothetical protein JS562_55390, partial [Agrobacterium sp. S2]|nr:hypothetical protein [Agrobacterium sp. S2]
MSATTPEHPKLSFGRWTRELGWRHLIGVIFVVYAAFPLVYLVSAALSSGGTLTGSNSLFSDVTGSNFEHVCSTAPS